VKIALILDHFHPAKGGAERSVERILHGLRERGHELLLVAQSAEPPPDLPLTVHAVAVPPFPRWRRDWIFANRSAVMVEKLNPDLVLAVRHTRKADVFLARGGLHSETIEGNLRANSSMLRRFSYRCLPKHRVLLGLEDELFRSARAPLVIAPSRMVQSHFLKRYDLAAGRVPVVHTGADLNYFQPADLPERERLRGELGVSGKIVALFAAHNFTLKGLHCLLRAWNHLDPARFQLLVAGRGKGPSQSGVRYLGHQPDPRGLYQAADVLVHPTFYDPFSRVVIEALACGLPVITTRFNGAAELVTDGREGFIIDDPHDAELLADRIRRFADPAGARSLSSAARQLAGQHPESGFLNRTVEWIESSEARRAAQEPA
jgi:UDP-glucose:(heptosyl)LPS alpha-1,3-glucosyltransferase